jgi:hypothetical protein
MVDVNGTAGNDELRAFDTDDRIYAYAGNDKLFGGLGNDLLDGMAGADMMFGGAGSDRYRIDNIGDVISEDENGDGVDDGGTDLVESSVTYTLGAFFENLTLTGTNAIDGSGNELANKINGNGAANIISGGGGKDTLTGDLGADTFVFGEADATSTDRITDFSADDRIGILAGAFGLSEGNGLTNGRLSDGYLSIVSSGTQATASHSQFVYSASTRTLMWDADGAGGAAGIAIATFASDIGSILSAEDFVSLGSSPPPPPPPPPALPTLAVSNGTPDPQGESDTAKITFTITLSAAAAEDVTVTYSTVNGTATAGTDFIGVAGGTFKIAAGQTSASVSITLRDDANVEPNESFKVQINDARLTSGAVLSVTTSSGTGTIQDNDAAPPPPPAAPTVVNIIDTRGLGSTDPSGLAYVPGKGLFLSDSEVDEAPFSQPNNLFQVGTNGTLQQPYSLATFTKEPTGLAFDSLNGRLLVADDDKYTVFWVDPGNPSVKLGQFLTKPVGGDDPEDIAFNPSNGHVFIVNGLSRTIVETDGSQQFSRITLPSVITDPEALAYDAEHDVFFVGGGFSYNIWVINRAGQILQTIDLLKNHRNQVSGTSAHVKDLEFAPSSNVNDDPGKMNLYVADYGNSHVNDGRMIEIDLGAGWLIA